MLCLRSLVICSALSVVSLTLAGCGSAIEGPDRYEISGNVTFEGKAVPAGQIRFSPDNKKGNHGPGTMAEIKDGKYKTEQGQGTVGGDMVVEISGWNVNGQVAETDSTPSITVLFPTFQVMTPLPKSKTTMDFAVPNSKSKAK